MTYTQKVVVDVYGPDKEEFVTHIMNHVKTAKTAFNVDIDQEVHDHDDSEECSHCYELYDNERRA